MRDGHTEGWNSWDEDFRAAQYISAVDYVRIQRARTVLMKEFETMMSGVDFLINMRDLVHTNFTGHPSAVFPSSLEDVEVKREGLKSMPSKQPRPVVITGHLNSDEKLLAFAHAYQNNSTAQHQHPDLEQWIRP